MRHQTSSWHKTGVLVVWASWIILRDLVWIRNFMAWLLCTKKNGVDLNLPIWKVHRKHTNHNNNNNNNNKKKNDNKKKGQKGRQGVYPPTTRIAVESRPRALKGKECVPLPPFFRSKLAVSFRECNLHASFSPKRRSMMMMMMMMMMMIRMMMVGYFSSYVSLERWEKWYPNISWILGCESRR